MHDSFSELENMTDEEVSALFNQASLKNSEFSSLPNKGKKLKKILKDGAENLKKNSTLRQDFENLYAR